MARKKEAMAKKVTAKRGPGRPRKTEEVGVPLLNRKPGRPAKKLPVATGNASQLSYNQLLAALSVHQKVLDDVRERANDTLYRLELVEDRLRQGPGLLPMLVTEGTDLNRLSPRTLAQLLLEKLAKIPEEPSQTAV